MVSGRIGVDVFFVISGYLITGILLREHKKGTYSIIRFYERRIKRILPVLFISISVYLVIVYLYIGKYTKDFLWACYLLLTHDIEPLVYEVQTFLCFKHSTKSSSIICFHQYELEPWNLVAILYFLAFHLSLHIQTEFSKKISDCWNIYCPFLWRCYRIEILF